MTRSTDTSSIGDRTQLIKEVLFVYLATLLVIRGVIFIQRATGLPSDVLVIVPLLFIYVPMWWLRRVGENPDDYGMVLERIWPALRLNILLYLLIFPAFIVINHFYQAYFFSREPQLLLPNDFWFNVVPYHLLYVALPEEFFYRGYMQNRLSQVFPKKWRIFGVQLGWGWLFTCLLFAFGHSIVQFQWWHFAIFFPSLIFGYLRERTGNVVAGAIFHALCNITMVVLDTSYGVISP